MRHFSLEEWVDFARDVVDPKKREAMQSHLDAGCKSCTGVLDLWRRVHRMTHRDTAFEPSDRVARNVTRMLALHRPSKPRSKRVAAATLLFDSFLQPGSVGVRSGESSTRQLLYGTEEFHVDLRIEPQEDPRKVAVVGQVLNASDPEQNCEQVPVTLFKHAKPRAEAITNRFGEFRLECLLESGLYLRVSLPEGPELRIPVLEPTLAEEHEGPKQTDSKIVKNMFPGRKKSTRKKD